LVERHKQIAIMSLPLDSARVLLDQRFASMRDAILAIGQVMLAHGDVTPRYVQGMLAKEAQYSTWVTEGVALPHGTNEVKNEVLRSSVVVAQAPQGVDWGGKMVYLAIGLAGRGDDSHLSLLASLAGVLQHPELVEKLRTSKDKNEVVRILTQRENPG